MSIKFFSTWEFSASNETVFQWEEVALSWRQWQMPESQSKALSRALPPSLISWQHGSTGLYTIYLLN